MVRRFLMPLLLAATSWTSVSVADPALAEGGADLPGVEAVAWTGHGTISPGLTMTPTFQTSLTFSADAVVYIGSEASGAGASCQFSGASVHAETLLAGAGAGTFNCLGGSPDTLVLSGFLNYTRSGETLTFSGSLSGAGGRPACVVRAAAATFEPTSTPAMTSYRHQGFVVLDCS